MTAPQTAAGIALNYEDEFDLGGVEVLTGNSLRDAKGVLPLALKISKLNYFLAMLEPSELIQL